MLSSPTFSTQPDCTTPSIQPLRDKLPERWICLSLSGTNPGHLCSTSPLESCPQLLKGGEASFVFSRSDCHWGREMSFVGGSLSLASGSALLSLRPQSHPITLPPLKPSHPQTGSPWLSQRSKSVPAGLPLQALYRGRPWSKACATTSVCSGR